MRKTLALGALTAALAVAVLPAAPASAWCNTTTYDLVGDCGNPCYWLSDLLPGDQHCPD